MLESEWLVIMGLGGVFILLGLAAFLWGKGEEKDYYNTISTRADAREYLEHWPHRPEPQALKIGGRIAISIGLLLIAIGGFLFLWG